MIKIQARMVVIPHTMAVCLIYSSMQAPGLFVPGLSACKEQGLFTFSLGLRKQAAHTFMLHSRGEFLDGVLLHLYTPQTSIHRTWKHLFFLSFLPSSFLSLSLFLCPVSVCLTGHSVAPYSSFSVFVSQMQISPSENSRSECQGEQQSLAPETFFFFFQ